MITESQLRIKNIRAVKEQLENITHLAIKAGHQTMLKTLSADIVTKLNAVEDQLIQNKAEVSQDNINYPRVFSNHIGRVYSVLVNAHQRPTGGVIERFADIKKEFAKIVEDYNAVFTEVVPKFNTMLEGEKVERVIIPEKW